MLKNLINFINPKANKCIGIDGDTVTIVGGIGNLLKKNIRLIGINTPESTGNTYRIPEEGGDEAKQYVKNILANRYVKIDMDSTNTVDKYGRTLAYVYIQDVEGFEFGADLAECLLIKGYAKVFNYKNQGFDKLQTYYDREAEAKTKKLGLWKNPIV
jgi:micrococcal nuclease